ncbi:cation:proton antiporter [Microbulbifer thermotolerans]|uniref:cation:proton antiporter n=1 Tax=Microbulbifer thermotolerans TaxID=252514 RepID=UPI0022499E9C|nr:sodium:proton antiporter [Microbulbifer thermotolerans]MCX2794049.1 sodium:proton antiporter [Microbulbifer thermotolerans]MCX2833359.1 sodium:proton antiporter [Microbulbifer thermotolerans]
MQVYYTFCFLAAISVFLGFLNQYVLRAQATIAITAGALALSLVVLGLGKLGIVELRSWADQLLPLLNLEDLLLKGMLGFLLFAGSLHIDLLALRNQRLEIGLLAVVGTLISTFAVGALLYWFLQQVGMPVAFVYCLLFGALISPTDPIAVLAIIKSLKAPEQVSIQVEGESLFNDGFGIVIFAVIYALAFEGGEPTLPAVAHLFALEAIGGVVLGLAIGGLFHWLICSTNDHSLELLLTLVIPTAGFSLANVLGVSGALAMVVSGIIIGNFTRETGFSRVSQHELDNFWTITEDFLNGLLFLLVGLFLITIDLQPFDYLIMGAGIIIVLLGRSIAVTVPFTVLKRFRRYHPYTERILIWGGLRGGLALALAMSIPAGHAMVQGQDLRHLWVVMTYGVVVFSIVVQGSTIAPLIRRSRGIAEPETKPEAGS